MNQTTKFTQVEYNLNYNIIGLAVVTATFSCFSEQSSTGSTTGNEKWSGPGQSTSPTGSSPEEVRVEIILPSDKPLFYPDPNQMWHRLKLGQSLNHKEEAQSMY